MLLSINNAVRLQRRGSLAADNASTPKEGSLAPSVLEEELDDDELLYGGFEPEAVHRDFTLKELIHGVVAGYSIGDEPSSTAWITASNCVTNLVFVVIILSVVSFGVSTLPQFKDGNPVTDGIEIFCVSVFTLELVIRGSTHRSQYEFWTNPLTWIDVVSILPFYLQLVLVGDNTASALVFFRVLRLVRVTRVFKLVKNNIGFEAVFESLVTSKEALSLMGFMIVVALCFFSSAIYFAEIDGNSFDYKSGQWVRPSGEVNPYQSMFHAMWWCIVTITTVGYGDDVPVTGGGKFVAAVAAVCGVFVISFPSAILGANFAEIHARKIRERVDAIRKARKAKLGRPEGNGKPAEATSTGDAGSPPATVAAGVRHTTSNGLQSGALVTRALSYVVDDDVPPREVVILQGVASYAPGLILLTQEADRWVLVARQEPLFPPPARNLVFTLILANQFIEDCVITALSQNGLDPSKYAVRPRPIDRLLVSAILTERLVEAGITLTTCEYTRPVGQVPIIFHCPQEDAEALLMSDMDQIELRFKVTYDACEDASLPLSNYRTAAVIRTRASMAVLRGGPSQMAMSLKKRPSRIDTGSSVVLLGDVNDAESTGEETPPAHPFLSA